MSEETDDARKYDAIIPQVSYLRTRVESNRRSYASAFTSHSFTQLLLTDGHVFVMYTIKAIKFALSYVTIRVAAQWFRNSVRNGTVTADDMPFVASRFVALTCILDIVVIGFLFSLDMALSSDSTRQLSLWSSMLVDSVCSDGVTAMTAMCLATIYKRRRYFNMKDSSLQQTTLAAYVQSITYVSIINTCIPYFLIA
jgi:hypothetical protein